MREITVSRNSAPKLTFGNFANAIDINNVLIIKEQRSFRSINHSVFSVKNIQNCNV